MFVNNDVQKIKKLTRDCFQTPNIIVFKLAAYHANTLFLSNMDTVRTEHIFEKKHLYCIYTEDIQKRDKSTRPYLSINNVHMGYVGVSTKGSYKL